MNMLRSQKSISVILCGLLSALVLAVLILASVPPVDRDGLTHHLAVPKLYLKQGGMVELPSVSFSYYPMNLDLLYLIPLYFGNDIVPKYIHFAFALLTAWLIQRYLHRRTQELGYSLLGALLFLSLPVVIKLSITVYVDLGLAFFTTASLLSLLRWANESYRARHLIVSAAFCGLALGTKYNSLVSFFLLACLVPVLYARGLEKLYPPPTSMITSAERFRLPLMQSTIRAFAWGGLFVFISLMVFSPWILRNIYWTGNPIYPLYQGFFKSFGDHQTSLPKETLTAEEETGEGGVSHFVVRHKVFNESLAETLTIPVRIFFQGEDDNPKYFDGRLNPCLFFLPLFVMVGFRRMPRRLQSDTLAMAGFSTALILYTFFTTDMRIRYIAPALPPLVIMAILGLRNLGRLVLEKLLPKCRWLAHALIGVGISLMLAPNLNYLVEQFEYVMPFDYVCGRVGRDDYITRFRKDYPAFQFVNRSLPADCRLLGLYMGNRLYYSERDLFFGDEFFERIMATSDSGESLALTLRDRGFTHLFVRGDVLEYVVRNSLSGRQVHVLKEFISTQTRSLFSEGFYHILELVHAPDRLNPGAGPSPQ
jgi:4-amino-4-deoxy-L-arabinose transferase-like glycosyltransferase